MDANRPKKKKVVLNLNGMSHRQMTLSETVCKMCVLTLISYVWLVQPIWPYTATHHNKLEIQKGYEPSINAERRAKQNSLFPPKLHTVYGRKMWTKIVKMNTTHRQKKNHTSTSLPLLKCWWLWGTRSKLTRTFTHSITRHSLIKFVKNFGV